MKSAILATACCDPSVPPRHTESLELGSKVVTVVGAVEYGGHADVVGRV
jgi:hypothetical protein